MLYMAAAVLLAAACSPEEDDIFSDSSANRADAAIAADMQVLTGAANGWLMEYYPEASQMYGGYKLRRCMEATTYCCLSVKTAV